MGFEGDKNRIPGIDKALRDNQEFKIGTLNFTVIFVPGHTKGHIAFHLEKEKVLFSGDTLFSLGCGRVFEGTYEEMFQSLNKLKNLPNRKPLKYLRGGRVTYRSLTWKLEFPCQR